MPLKKKPKPFHSNGDCFYCHKLNIIGLLFYIFSFIIIYSDFSIDKITLVYKYTTCFINNTILCIRGWNLHKYKLYATILVIWVYAST